MTRIPKNSDFSATSSIRVSFLGLANNPALDFLRSKNQWVAWRYVSREQPVPSGAQKLAPRITKPPIDPKNGSLASVSDAKTWGSYQQAETHAVDKGLPGVGFVLTSDCGLIGYDLDDCIDENGSPEPWVQEILDYKETYAEISPSGKGIRLLALGKLEKAVKFDPAHVEIYGEGRFLTITGSRVPGAPDEIRVAPKTHQKLLDRVEAEKSRQRSGAVKQLSATSSKSKLGSDFYPNVNELALEKLDLWVPGLLPQAKLVSHGQGYRVRSEDLNRDNEEDLSIHPFGIVDFGVADMGDSKEGKRSAIDLVIEYGDDVGLEFETALDPADLQETHVVKGRNAWKAAKWLCETLGVTAQDLGSSDQSPRVVLELMNEKFCVVKVGGKVRVLSFSQITVGNANREIAEYMDFGNFKQYYSNKFVAIESYKDVFEKGNWVSKPQVEEVPVGKWWLAQRDRRQYEGVVFDPGKRPKVGEFLNLWRGFAIKARPGDWSLMKQHIDENLASGVAEYAEYILKWCAFCVQHPDRRAEASMVFVGTKGTGKGTLGNLMLQIFGQHGVHISNPNHLVGNFNAHLFETCFLFADEAYWPGNKGAEGQLKRLITEPTLTIERKGLDTFACTNMLHVLMASNEKWVVPAGEDERRYAVFQVSDHRKGDHAYFNALYAQLENGGRAAMLHDLLHLDLSGWHPKYIPVTDALRHQQEVNLSPEDAWWKDLLDDGVVPGAIRENPDWTFSSTLFTHARESSPKLKSYSDHQLGAYLKEKGCNNKERSGGKRGWRFPALDAARRQWESSFSDTNWQDPNLVKWQVIELDFNELFKEKH